jgi:hypothetical protein
MERWQMDTIFTRNTRKQNKNPFGDLGIDESLKVKFILNIMFLDWIQLTHDRIQ